MLDLPRLLETRMLLQSNAGGGKFWALRRLQIVPSFYVVLTLLDCLLHAPGRVTPEALAHERSNEMAGIVPRVARSLRRSIQRFETLGFRPEAS